MSILKLKVLLAMGTVFTVLSRPILHLLNLRSKIIYNINHFLSVYSDHLPFSKPFQNASDLIK